MTELKTTSSVVWIEFLFDIFKASISYQLAIQFVTVEQKYRGVQFSGHISCPCSFGIKAS